MENLWPHNLWSHNEGPCCTGQEQEPRTVDIFLGATLFLIIPHISNTFTSTVAEILKCGPDRKCRFCWWQGRSSFEQALVDVESITLECGARRGSSVLLSWPAAVVWGRRWVSPSLRCLCLHSSLFPKKRRGDLGPGRRAAAIIGESWQNRHFQRRYRVVKRVGHGGFLLTFGRKRHGERKGADCCLACAAGPALLCRHNNGQNNYCKSNVVTTEEDDFPQIKRPIFAWDKALKAHIPDRAIVRLCFLFFYVFF